MSLHKGETELQKTKQAEHCWETGEKVQSVSGWKKGNGSRQRCLHDHGRPIEGSRD